MKLFLARVEFYSEKFDEFQGDDHVMFHNVRAEKRDQVEGKVIHYYMALGQDSKTEYDVKSVQVTETIE